MPLAWCSNGPFWLQIAARRWHLGGPVSLRTRPFALEASIIDDRLQHEIP